MTNFMEKRTRSKLNIDFQVCSPNNGLRNKFVVKIKFDSNQNEIFAIPTKKQHTRRERERENQTI